jgi:UDP-N-acetyl-D-glucosamine/UDP-N-acetyl-D-galactosamine dehydrogenase
MNRKISVIGLGYVGLPVAVAFGKNSKVIGFDVNEKRITELRQGHDSTHEVEKKDLKSADIHFTSNPEDLRQADFHIVAVPTPINEAKQPDLGPLLAATNTIGNIINPGDIVVYESTVYPGCTEEDCAPILEKQSGLEYINTFTTLRHCVNQNGFYLGYSPERINPGDKEHTFTNIKKVISGSTPEAIEIIAKTYSSVVNAGVYRASSIKVAEAAKVIENAQRDLNIAFVNELALIFDLLGIDTHEVLEAAGTKWNFLQFKPGLVGGHCIGVDPYYLTHKAEKLGYHPQIILAGRRINDGIGKIIAQRLIKELIHAGHQILGSLVTILGLTFKENCPDLRNSKAIDIVKELEDFGVIVQVNDTHANPEEIKEKFGDRHFSMDLLQPAQAVIVAVTHKTYLDLKLSEIASLIKKDGVFIDVKGVFNSKEVEKLDIRYWSL